MLSLHTAFPLQELLWRHIDGKSSQEREGACRDELLSLTPAVIPDQRLASGTQFRACTPGPPGPSYGEHCPDAFLRRA